VEPPELTVDDLRLRPWRPTDAEAVHRACQDPAIQRWTAVPAPYRLEHARDFVADRARRVWAAWTAAPFAVCDATSGELLGACGLVTIDPVLRSAEIGYWTTPWARGRGVAARASRAIAGWAFDTLGLRRIVWQAEVGNHASRLAALRAGFRVEGRLRLADPHPRGGGDAWVGSLLPADLTGPPDPAVGPGSLVARRAAIFGRPQPVLFAVAPDGTELSLRPLRADDRDGVVTGSRDPQTVRWTTVPDPYQPSDADGFIGRYAPGVWALGTGAVFAVTGPDDRYAGTMELRISPADPLLADVGFVIAPHARGRGWCPAALAAVSTWGFTSLGLARIEWRANIGNTASRRVAEKAGFTIEGTARQALSHRGVRTDAWVGALVAGDSMPAPPEPDRTVPAPPEPGTIGTTPPEREARG
jgi:RimJ/RimL family protein N-acetyltransferase